MKKSISIEMDFVVAQRILSNQEKLKNQLRSKKHTSIVKKEETDIEDKRYKSYSDCIKCGQNLIWCYCMFY
tara:strand:+ start:1938 stop:2150 length:213 start_codon:yes stop_codon:yes gene_type:complete